MSKSSRNFYSIDVGRSRTTSGPASDLAERILATLNGAGALTEVSLAETIGGNPTEIKELVHTMINQRLIERSAKMNLALSAAGTVALENKLLSISSGDSV